MERVEEEDDDDVVVQRVDEVGQIYIIFKR